MDLENFQNIDLLDADKQTVILNEVIRKTFSGIETAKIESVIKAIQKNCSIINSPNNNEGIIFYDRGVFIKECKTLQEFTDCLEEYLKAAIKSLKVFNPN